LGLALAAAWTASGEAGQRGTLRTSPTPTPTYLDVSREAGLTFTNVNGASPQKRLVETMGSGGLFVDADNDGWIDIFLVDGGSEADPAVARTARHRLYRNRRNGTFEDVTSSSGIRHREYGMGACAGDYDNDGLVDLYVTNVGPNVLYRNSGGGAFADVTQKAGIASALWGTSCAFADFDKDGRLDLFVTNYVEMGKDRDRFCGSTQPMMRQYCHPLVFQGSPNVVYRNAGNGTFTDVTARAGIARYRGNGLGVAIADYDDDSWPDVFVANDGVPNFLFHNDGRGGFMDDALVAGVSSASDGRSRAGMGTAFGDVDGDGRTDLVVTNHETEMHSLFRNLGDGSFADATVESGVGPATLPYVGFGVVLADYDNDGDLDLAIVNGHVIDNVALVRSGAKHAQARLLLQNAGTGRFRDVSAQSGSAFAVDAVGRGLAAGDIDNDGDLDLLATSNGGAAALLRNDGGNRNNALLVRLIGGSTSLTTDPGRVERVGMSNRDGIGARLRATTGTRTQMRELTSGSSYLSQNDARVHIGLGSAAAVDRLDIRWPSGQTETLQKVSANQIITVRESAGIVGTVPFIR
jgi:hypothetical protein